MKHKKLLSLLLAVVMVLSLAVPALAAEEETLLTTTAAPAITAKADGEIRILYTNDVHTYIDNETKNADGETINGLRYSLIKGYKKAFDADFLVDAGDHIQGTVYGAEDNGITVVELMNEAGYDVATLGNHEFDYDIPGTLKVIETAKYDYVSCNIYHNGERLLEPYKVFEAGGKKVAFVGFTTPESITKSTPKYFMDESGNIVYSFSEGDEGTKLYAEAQAAIDAAAKEADMVIGIGHMGVDEASAPYTSEDIIKNTSGLTAFIDGHSHTKMELKLVTDKEGKEIPLTQTQCYLAYVGEMTISPEGEVSTRLLTGDDILAMGVEPDAELAAKEQAFIDKVQTKLSTVIGATEVELSINGADGKRGIRKEELPLGNLCADGYLYAAEKNGFEADVAFIQGGGIRATIPVGEISAKVIKTVYPWDGEVMIQAVTGQELLDALEWSCRTMNAENTNEVGGFLQVAGMKFDVYVDVPSTVQQNDQSIWTGGPENGVYRVRNVQIKNRTTGEYEPLDLNKTYKVCSAKYLLQELGDGYGMFKGEVLAGYVCNDYSTLVDLFQTFPKDAATGLPTLKAGAGYDAKEGRINVVLGDPDAAAEDDDVIKILHTNDVHTYIDNTTKNADGEKVNGLRYSLIAGYKKAIGADFLVDAGDHIQGTVYGTYDKGETIIKLMNAAGYTASTLGNHEFDYDMTRTQELIAMAEYPYVSANIINKETGEQLLKSYEVFEAANGKKVAFVGFTTPESITKSTPKYFMDESGKVVWSFAEDEAKTGAELYRVAQAAIDAAAKEADYVIGVGHMGVDVGSAPYTSEDIIKNTTGLTAFIDGHSHTKMEYKEVTDKAGKTVVLSQTQCYLAYVGEMTIKADGTVTTKLLTGDDILALGVEPDAAVAAIEDETITAVETELSKVVGATEVKLPLNDADGARMVRNQETAIGNFCADATYYYFDSKGYDIDIAFMNGGGIRAVLDGEITAKTLQSLYPWGNVLCLVDMTGQQILDGLEFGSKNTKLPSAVDGNAQGESGGFLQVSGLKYTINVGIPNTTVSDENGIWLSGPTGEYRVRDVQVLNRETGEYEPLDLDKHYTVGGINYTLRQLGDGFAMFTGENIVDGVAVDYMAPLEYIQSFAKDETTGLPTIKAGDGYDAVEGRITIVNEPAKVYPADVVEGKWWTAVAKEAIDKGLMIGTGKGFEAETAVTKASVIQTLYRLEGNPEVTAPEGNLAGLSFSAKKDEMEGKWYADSMLWAISTGLVDGDFTEGVCDRQTAMAILKAYTEAKGLTFEGLFIGNEKGDLMTEKEFTRAEYAQVLLRLEAKKAA